MSKIKARVDLGQRDVDSFGAWWVHRRKQPSSIPQASAWFFTYGRFANMMKFSDIKADCPQEFSTIHRFISEPDVGPGSGLAGFISEPDVGTTGDIPFPTFESQGFASLGDIW